MLTIGIAKRVCGIGIGSVALTLTAIIPDGLAQSSADALVVSGIPQGAAVDVVVAQRARGSTCTCEDTYSIAQILSGAPTLDPLADLESDTVCGHSEVFVLAPDRSLGQPTVPILAGQEGWTQGSETLPVHLPSIRNLTLRVRWLDGLTIPLTDPATGASSMVEPDLVIQTDVARANLLFDAKSHCGVVFTADVARMQPPGGALNSDCGSVGALVKQDFQIGVVNVYYVAFDRTGSATGTSHRGSYCGIHEDVGQTGTAPVVLISARTSNPETLAHELGHVFSLDHVQDDPEHGLDTMALARNVMFADPSVACLPGQPGCEEVRDSFNLGQCVRMNVHHDSFLRDIAGRSAHGCVSAPFLCPPAVVPTKRCRQ